MRSRTRGPPGSIGWSVIYKMVGRRPPDSKPTGPGRVGPAGPGRKPQPGSRRKAPEPRAPSGSYESVGRRAREPEVEPARAARAGRRPEWLHERLMAHAGSRTESRSRLADALAGGRGHPRGLWGRLADSEGRWSQGDMAAGRAGPGPLARPRSARAWNRTPTTRMDRARGNSPDGVPSVARRGCWSGPGRAGPGPRPMIADWRLQARSFRTCYRRLAALASLALARLAGLSYVLSGDADGGGAALRVTRADVKQGQEKVSGLLARSNH